MLRWRPAFVFLCSACLITLRLPPAASEVHGSVDGITQVDYLITEASTTARLDCQLYTPELQDYGSCPNATLLCFASELKVLIDEWKSVKKLKRVYLGRILVDLADKLSEQSGKVESSCPQCESHGESNAITFLKSIRTTLEFINSQAAQPTPKGLQER